jgi:hypothetical protein
VLSIVALFNCSRAKRMLAAQASRTFLNFKKNQVAPGREQRTGWIYFEIAAG